MYSSPLKSPQALYLSLSRQGLGGGGIALLINTVVADLVSLRERGTYMALTQIAATLRAALGPFIGGLIVGRTTWRWVFYLNLPIGGSKFYTLFAVSLLLKYSLPIAAFILLFVFLRLKHERDQSWKQRIARIDFSGNLIFILAIVAVLIALTWAGTIYSWDKFRIIVPLILGFVGLAIFIVFEWTLSKVPSFPRAVVANRTSATALLLTFLHAVCTYWAFYFLPIYFQAVRGYSPLRSGEHTYARRQSKNLLPT